MPHIISSAKVGELQLICGLQRHKASCGPDCPIKCICGEQVRDWPTRKEGDTDEEDSDY